MGIYLRYTTESFIIACKKIHGNRYNYDSVVYIKSYLKVTFECPKAGHGPWFQTPRSHLMGKGCWKCARERNRLKGMNNFFQRARKIHGNKYKYGAYKGYNNRMEIFCPVEDHGMFLQTPCNHTYQKSGCPLCNVNQAKHDIKGDI